jgi:hypothetical protein
MKKTEILSVLKNRQTELIKQTLDLFDEAFSFEPASIDFCFIYEGQFKKINVYYNYNDSIQITSEFYFLHFDAFEYKLISNIVKRTNEGVGNLDFFFSTLIKRSIDCKLMKICIANI